MRTRARTRALLKAQRKVIKSVERARRFFGEATFMRERINAMNNIRHIKGALGGPLSRRQWRSIADRLAQ